MSLFIQRPVMTTLLMVAILAAGIAGYRQARETLARLLG